MDHPITWVTSAVQNFCEVLLAPGGKYISIELQSAERNGARGFIALLNYSEGGMDILYEEQLGLDGEWAATEPATAHMEVRNLQATSMIDCHCFVSASEVDIQATFDDSAGDRVEFRVKHTFRRVNRPVFTPAPPQTNPYCLRFITMDVFHLLPRNSEIDIRINGEHQAIAHFMLPGAIAPYTSTKVGGGLLLTALSVRRDTRPNLSRSVLDSNGLRVTDEDNWLELVGLPSADEMRQMNTGDSASGSFHVASPLGTLATGRFLAARNDEEISIRLNNVRQDWAPGWRSPRWMLMRWIRNRNRRHENWSLHALIRQRDDGEWQYDGAWTN